MDVRIRGREKEIAMYEAVLTLLGEGASIEKIKVSDITKKAGIGKGTAYEYFDSKEEIFAGAFIHFKDKIMDRLATSFQGRATMPFREGVDILMTMMDESFDGSEGKIFAQFLFFNMFPVKGCENSKGQMLHSGCMGADPMQNIVVHVKDMVQMYQEKGEIRADIPTEYITITILAKLSACMIYYVKNVQQDTLIEGGISPHEMQMRIKQSILDEFAII